MHRLRLDISASRTFVGKSFVGDVGGGENQGLDGSRFSRWVCGYDVVSGGVDVRREEDGREI